MAVYVGRSGSKKKAVSIYVGKGSSKKEVTEAYYGSSKKQVYSYKADPGQQVFTSSGTFTVPKGVKSVDVFLVGGGGRGCQGSASEGTGGGGGFTTTAKNVSVNPGNTWNVIVGDGARGFYGTLQTQGGSSTTLGYKADGGYSGGSFDASTAPNFNNISYGGSGGGYNNGRGGSDGSCGFIQNNTKGKDQYPWYYINNNLCGQGSTTRAFGESTGTLYAGGGGGMGSSADSNSTDYYKSYTAGGAGGGGNGGWRDSHYHSGGISSGAPNTGGGSGAGGSLWTDGLGAYVTGGSGIVIIRWGY